MIHYTRDSRRWHVRWNGYAPWIVSLSLVVLIGCGGVGRVPNPPQDMLDRGDHFFERKKYREAQEVYQTFLQRYPGHERSDYAQFMLAESYYGEEEYPLASLEYRILITNYGYSDYVDDGYFMEAKALHMQAPKVQLDQTKNQEALDRLQRFVQVFSQSPRVPEAQEQIQKIQAILAEKSYLSAMFYMRNKRYRSAMIYFDKIIDNYPNNDYWARALYEKGVILRKRGEIDEAVRAFSEVLAYPNDVEVKKKARDELKKLRSASN